MDSILNSIKKPLNISVHDPSFDADIIMLINSNFSRLFDIGVGPSTSFKITGASESWSDFSTNDELVTMAHEYIYLKTRMVFDPPASSFVLDAMNIEADELFWRLYSKAERSTT